MDLTGLLILYLCFRTKQLCCDWLLQTSWMAQEKGKPFKTGGFAPLAVHSAIHGVGTLAVTLILAPAFWWLAPIDVLIHGSIDRLKETFRIRNNLSPEDGWYWWAIGIDQEAHNLTHLAYIILIYQASTGV